MTILEGTQTIRVRHGLTKREKESLITAMHKEMAVDGKWFKGSNNRIYRVVSALAQQRPGPFPKKHVLNDANALLIELKHQNRREYEARKAKRALLAELSPALQ